MTPVSGRVRCLVVPILMLVPSLDVQAQDLSGRVVADHDGSPVASADVRVHRVGQIRLAAELETDRDGRFGGEGLGPGEYWAEIVKPNYLETSVPFFIEPGEPVFLNLPLIRCGTISGNVKDQSGRTVAGAAILAMVRTPSGLQLPDSFQGNYTVLDDTGEFRLYNLPPGDYVVALSYGASPRRFGPLGRVPTRSELGSGVVLYPSNEQPRYFTISAGEEYTGIHFMILPEPKYSVGGKVELPDPRAIAWVTLTATDRSAGALAATSVGNDGAFQLDGIPQGSYEVFAVGPVRGRSGFGAMLGEDPFYARARVVVAGRDVEDVLLVPESGPGVVFVLRHEQSAELTCPKAVPVALVGLEDWGARAMDSNIEASIGNKRVVNSLAPSRYRVTAMKLGDGCYQSGEVMLDLSDARETVTVEIPLSGAGAVQGNLAGLTEAEDLVVVLRDADPLSGDRTVRAAVPDENGHFLLEDLPPGRYWLGVVPASDTHGHWMVPVERRIDIEVHGGIPTGVDLPAALAWHEGP